MSKFHATTKKAQEVWRSPDGDRIIWSVTMEIQGENRPVIAKTYSKAIAAEGWSGEVESYQKQGRDGMESFVKQPPKEGGFGGARQPRDDASIKAQFAIKAAIAWVSSREGSGFDDIEGCAVEFYKMIERVKSGQTTAPDKVYPLEEDQEPIDLTGVRDVFGV